MTPAEARRLKARCGPCAPVTGTAPTGAAGDVHARVAAVDAEAFLKEAASGAGAIDTWPVIPLIRAHDRHLKTAQDRRERHTAMNGEVSALGQAPIGRVHAGLCELASPMP
ncbi:hypothetical protein GCM10023259_064580 [Thermocatellispora tengchongensis]